MNRKEGGSPPALPQRRVARPLPQASAAEDGLMVVVTAQIVPVRGRASAAPVLIEQRPFASPARRRRRWGLLLFPPLVTLPAAVLAWFLWPSGSAPNRQVEIALPDDVEVDLPPSATPPSITRLHKGAPKPRPAALVPKRWDQAKLPRSELVRIDRLPEVQASIRAAIATGVAQSWSSDGIKGYSIAAPVQIDGDHICRNLVIWAEGPGGRGDTIKRRKCLGASKAWVDDDALAEKSATATAEN